VREISVQELAERRTSGADVIVLDIREHFEREVAVLSGCVHIPMRDVPQRLQELPTDREILVLCHTGRRSAVVVQMLTAAHFSAANVRGGIHAWSLQIDPSVPTY